MGNVVLELNGRTLVAPLGLQPLEHCPGGSQVLAIVFEDRVHEFGPQGLVLRFGGFDVLRHRPLSTIFLLSPAEADVRLDHL